MYVCIETIWESGERDRVNEFGTRATLSQRAIDNVCMHRNNMERGGKNSPKKKKKNGVVGWGKVLEHNKDETGERASETKRANTKRTQ
jgi:hypothetical protein